MPQLPKQPPKQDFMKYFSRHCAGVKLLALVLIVLMEWGKTALYIGIPTSVAWVLVRHVA